MYGVIANIVSDSAFRTGAKVYILWEHGGDMEHAFVQGLSKGGKVIRKYVQNKRLMNFRAAWLPDHLWSSLSSPLKSWKKRSDAQEDAERLTWMWAGVRAFNRDGAALVKPGISAGAMWRDLNASRIGPRQL